MGPPKKDDEVTRTSLSVRRMKARAASKSPEELEQDDKFEPTVLSGKKRLPPRERVSASSKSAPKEATPAPRPKVAPPEILAGLQVRLLDATSAKESQAGLVKRLAKEWLPLLRHAVEQGGGDGIDSWLNVVLKLPAVSNGIDVLLIELGVTFERMRGAEDVASAVAEAGYAIDAVQRALKSPRRLSLKGLQRELDGKLDVEDVLKVVLAGVPELEQRLAELAPILTKQKEQFSQMGRSKADGLYLNYARLKAERRLIEGELERRKLV